MRNVSPRMKSVLAVRLRRPVPSESREVIVELDYFVKKMSKDELFIKAVREYPLHYNVCDLKKLRRI